MSTISIENIAHTNGTTGVNINTSGMIIMPNRPAFSVQSTKNSAFGADNSFSQSHSAPTVNLNQGSHFKTSGANDGKFVAPFAGLYYFDFQGMTANSSNNNDSGTTRAHFTKNGDAEANRVGRWAYDYQDNSHTVFTMHEILLLAADDVIGVRVSNRYFYSVTNYGGNPQFAGYFIG
tara:strand:+ start:87 stop:617 length:531 start_codon:yes stop_codon:yes gene_type:complete